MTRAERMCWQRSTLQNRWEVRYLCAIVHSLGGPANRRSASVGPSSAGSSRAAFRMATVKSSCRSRLPRFVSDRVVFPAEQLAGNTMRDCRGGTLSSPRQDRKTDCRGGPSAPPHSPLFWEPSSSRFLDCQTAIPLLHPARTRTQEPSRRKKEVAAN